jgi:hypothetical protein
VCFDKDDPHVACEAITRTSAERWETRDPDRRRDDITVMVIKLWAKQQKPKPVDAEDMDLKVGA